MFADVLRDCSEKCNLFQVQITMSVDEVKVFYQLAVVGI